MTSNNSFVAAILFSVGATLASSEIWCRLTEPYNKKRVMIFFAVLVPFILIGVGLYFQFKSPTKSPTSTLEEREKIWNSTWSASNGETIQLRQDILLKGNEEVIAGGTLNGLQVTGSYVSKDQPEPFIGKFSRQLTTFTLTTKDNSNPILQVVSPECTWDNWSWSFQTEGPNTDKWYSFEKLLTIIGNSDVIATGHLNGATFHGLQGDNDIMVYGVFSDNFTAFAFQDKVYRYQGPM